MENQNMISYFQRGLKNYANFNGRDTRPQFWWYYLAVFIITFVAGFIAGLINVRLLSTLVSLVFIVPNIAAGVRRMHDVGKSGWFLLIPIYNIVLLATEGEERENEYGPNPRGKKDNSFDFENQQFNH